MMVEMVVIDASDDDLDISILLKDYTTDMIKKKW